MIVEKWSLLPPPPLLPLPPLHHPLLAEAMAGQGDRRESHTWGRMCLFPWGWLKLLGVLLMVIASVIPLILQSGTCLILALSQSRKWFSAVACSAIIYLKTLLPERCFSACEWKLWPESPYQPPHCALSIWPPMVWWFPWYMNQCSLCTKLCR